MQRTNVWQSVFARHDARVAFVEANSNKAVTLLDMATHTRGRFEHPCQAIQWLEFTPDDRRLLTVSSQPGAAKGLPFVLTIWEDDTGKQMWRRAIRAIYVILRSSVVAPLPSPRTARPSPPFSRLVGCKCWKPKTAPAVNIRTTQERAMAVAFSPDSSTLVTGAAFADDLPSGSGMRTTVRRPVHWRVRRHLGK